MTLQFFTGTFNSRTSIGTDAITGVGFTPKVIVIYTSADDGTVDSTGTYLQFALGAAVDTTAANQKCIYNESQDAAATSVTSSDWQNAGVITLHNLSDKAAISAIGADGFTVNWTARDPSASNMDYFCIGGTDVTNTKCGQFNSPATGVTGNQATTGVGFKPDIVMLFSSGGVTDGTNRSGCLLGIGFATSSANQVCMSTVSKNAQATMSTKKYQRGDNTACFALIDETTVTNKGLEGALVTMDSDGFTINWTTVSASGATKKIAYVAIKGGNFKCGAITAPVAGTPPVSQATTGTGFQPTGLIMTSTGATSSTAIAANNKIIFGSASSATARKCVCTVDNDAVANAVTMNVNKSAKIFTNYTAPTTLLAEADLTSLDSNGFTLSWTTRDTNAYEALYLAVGSGVITIPQTVFVEWEES